MRRREIEGEQKRLVQEKFPFISLLESLRASVDGSGFQKENNLKHKHTEGCDH